MSNPTSVPAQEHATTPTPPLIHLCDRGQSTRTHHRLLDGTYHSIEYSLTCVIDLGEAQRAYTNNTGFHLCTECVEAQSARARAQRQAQERVKLNAAIGVRKGELLGELIEAHKSGTDVVHLLEELAQLEEQQDNASTSEAAK